MSTDGIIKAGLWIQLLLLALLDWGTLTAFARQQVSPWHYAGFVLMNLVLAGLFAVMQQWLRPRRSSRLDDR